MLEDRHGQPFLNTQRSLSVAAREFARLGDCLADSLASAFPEAMHGQPDLRRSPDRCIIQVGRAAVTIAWIRTRRDSGESELLIIHWRGMVAPIIKQQFERARELTLTATPLSESVYFAEATCEADWMWRSREEPVRRYSSPFLAGVIVDRLRADHETIEKRISA